jgi:hypothetical protein
VFGRHGLLPFVAGVIVSTFTKSDDCKKLQDKMHKKETAFSFLVYQSSRPISQLSCCQPPSAASI